MDTRGAAIVLLDRHPIWLDCISSIIDRMGFRVVAATTEPEEALAAISEHSPRLFVIDPATPDGDSEWLGLIDEARAAAPDIKVVAMSACGEPEAIEAAFAAGASAYLVKTASESDIGAALRLAVTTAIHVARGVPTPVQPRVRGANALTRREFEILALVAEGNSNAAIGRKLWVTEQTVKFHLSNVYRKIGVQNRTAAARWAEHHGVSPVGDGDSDDDSVVAGSVA
jgi:DNA-binding NarL/FixJ family response regulator